MQLTDLAPQSSRKVEILLVMTYTVDSAYNTHGYKGQKVI